MKFATALATAMANIQGARRQPSPQPPRDPEPALKATCTALAHFLGGDPSVYRGLALDCHRAMHAVVADRQAGIVGAPGEAQVREMLGSALSAGVAWLALPYSASGLHLLRRLPGWVDAPITLVSSPTMPDAPSPGRTQIIASPAALAVRQARAAMAAPLRPQLFVSFPELHALRADTTARVSFLGQPCRFPLLEAALCGAGLQSLLTLGHDPSSGSGATALIAWQAPGPTQAGQRERLGSALSWLLMNIQALAQAVPESTGSWSHWYARSEHAMAVQRGNRLRECQAFFEAWRRRGTGLPDSAHAQVQDRLRAMQVMSTRS